MQGIENANAKRKVIALPFEFWQAPYASEIANEVIAGSISI